jgi:hypothetical protein
MFALEGVSLASGVHRNLDISFDRTTLDCRIATTYHLYYLYEPLGAEAFWKFFRITNSNDPANMFLWFIGRFFSILCSVFFFVYRNKGRAALSMDLYDQFCYISA